MLVTLVTEEAKPTQSVTRYWHPTTVCPLKESGYLMEDYSVDTQYFGKISSGYIDLTPKSDICTNLKEFHDYLAYWLNYTHLSDRIFIVDKL